MIRAYFQAIGTVSCRLDFLQVLHRTEILIRSAKSTRDLKCYQIHDTIVMLFVNKQIIVLVPRNLFHGYMVDIYTQLYKFCQKTLKRLMAGVCTFIIDTN